MASMSMRALLVAALVTVVAGCGGEGQREVRLLAPVGIVADAQAAQFERQTGCRVDLRVYDADEDIQAIAGRRDTDVIARPTPDGETPDLSEALVRVTLDGGVVVTVPHRLAAALDPLLIRPAGRRDLSWTIREEGDNDDCARRWIAYATSQ
jgi:hypothetical protein